MTRPTVFVLFLLVAACTADYLSETEVHVRDINSESEVNHDDLPDRLEVALEHTSSRRDVSFPNLRLRRNEEVEHVPFSIDGVPQPNTFSNVRFYRDPSNHAVVTVSHEKIGDSHHRFMRGSFMMDGRMFEIEPSDDGSENEAMRHLSVGSEKRASEDVEGMRSLPIDSKKGPPEDNEDMRSLSIDSKKGPPEDNEDMRSSSMKSKRRTHVVRELKHFFDTRTPNDYQVVRPQDAGSHNISVRDESQSKRGSGSFLVEMIWLVDSAAYEYWKATHGGDMNKLKEYFSHQLNGMGMSYDKMESSGLPVALSITEVKIFTTTSGFRATSDVRTGSVNSNNKRESLNNDRALEEINKWKKANGYNWYNPDHLMVWTGYDLQGSVVGYAPVGGVCQPNRGHSILEIMGWQAWSVAAHELGHNLGMRHDGENGCSGSRGNIMGSSLPKLDGSNKEEPFKFSSCSLSDAKKCLRGEDNSKFPRICLEDNYCRNGVPKVSGLPGEHASVDDQCKDVYGTKVTKGTCSWKPADRDDFCQSLWCSLISSNSCNYGMARPADGTPCAGGSKWCIHGFCVSKSNKPSMPHHSCQVQHPVTDIPSSCKDDPNKSNDCTGNIREWPGLNCRNSYWKKTCCHTCASFGFK